MTELHTTLGYVKAVLVYVFKNIVSVSHTPNQANLNTKSNVEQRAQPRVQHNNLFQPGLVLGMGN